MCRTREHDWQPSESSRLCSEHFQKSCFQNWMQWCMKASENLQLIEGSMANIFPNTDEKILLDSSIRSAILKAPVQLESADLSAGRPLIGHPPLTSAKEKRGNTFVFPALFIKIDILANLCTESMYNDQKCISASKSHCLMKKKFSTGRVL